MQLRIAGSPYMDLNAKRQLLHDIQNMGRDPGVRDFEQDRLDRKGLNRLKKEVGRFKK